MGNYVASEIVKCMIKKNIPVNGSKVLILGITFKENCPDVRNTKAVDLITALNDYGTNITIHDPWADEDEVMYEYGLKSLKSIPNKKFDAIVLTVSHHKFKEIDLLSLRNENGVIYDVKNFLDKNIIDASL
jgi:UDP-N-acetyl-D-galactosamine dehydrogenase